MEFRLVEEVVSRQGTHLGTTGIQRVLGGAAEPHLVLECANSAQ